jgi:transcriptional regulator with XRE-family HTH domain
MHSTSPPSTVRLRLDVFAGWAAREGLTTEGEQAERIGVGRTTLSRVRRGEIAPGEKFIAAVLTATEKPFEEFFEIAEAS